MQNIFSGIKNPALRQGLIFGLIFGLVPVALGFFISFGLLIVLGFYFVVALFAAQRASRQTGNLKTGVLAGLWTGLFGSLVASIIPLIFDFLNLDAVRQSLQALADQQKLHVHYDIGVTVSSLLINFAIIIAIAILISLAGGAVGGLMGRNRAAPPKDPYEEAMFEPPSTTTQK
jgi:hypothetical protein